MIETWELCCLPNEAPAGWALLHDGHCHKERLEVCVGGEHEDSQLRCVDLVVHKGAGGAEGSVSFQPVWFIILTSHACGAQLMKL